MSEQEGAKMAAGNDRKKFMLHYGGEEFEIPNGEILDDVDFEVPGYLRLNLGSGEWLTIATGPGIPIAITERTVRQVRVL